MASLSHARKLESLARQGRSIGDLHRQRRELERRLSRATRKMILEAHAAGLNNAEIADLIGEVSPEAIRQQAEVIGSVNPRALKKRGRAPSPAAMPPPSDPS